MIASTVALNGIGDPIKELVSLIVLSVNSATYTFLIPWMQKLNPQGLIRKMNSKPVLQRSNYNFH